MSFLKERNESCQSLRQVRLLHNKWRHHLPPPPQFRHGTGGERNILQPPVPMDSAATAHKTFRPTDLASTYSVCTQRVFGGMKPRPSSLEYDALITRLPTAQQLPTFKITRGVGTCNFAYVACAKLAITASFRIMSPIDCNNM
ncbi:uncharacterized protein TNCV_502521 [Trichonephila clavipes]|nr:uncharacterized protein TNCV_502521 [Trichonephila clavipes]